MVIPVELSRFSLSTLSLNWLVSMEKQVITVVLKVINSFVMVFFILNCLLLLHCTMCIAKWFAFYLWNFNKIWSKFSNVVFLLFNQSEHQSLICCKKNRFSQESVGTEKRPECQSLVCLDVCGNAEAGNSVKQTQSVLSLKACAYFPRQNL